MVEMWQDDSAGVTPQRTAAMRPYATRRATIEDIPELMAISDSYPFTRPWDELDFRTAIEDPEMSIRVVITDVRVVCFAMFSICPHGVTVMHIATHSDYVRQGAGRKMMNIILINLALSRRLWARVAIRDNRESIPAMRFFASLGFHAETTLTEKEAGFEGGALVMRMIPTPLTTPHTGTVGHA